MMVEKPIEGQHPNLTDNPSDRIREVIFLIRKLMQAGEIYTKELNKKFNISAPQSACLLVLHEDGPLSISQIAARIMVKSSTLTGIIDRLEKKDLVFRTRQSLDRRVITIELTPAGQELATRAPPPIQQKIVQGLSRLNEAELAVIVQSLNKLTEMIDGPELGEEVVEAGFV